VPSAMPHGRKAYDIWTIGRRAILRAARDSLRRLLSAHRGMPRSLAWSRGFFGAFGVESKAFEDFS